MTQVGDEAGTPDGMDRGAGLESTLCALIERQRALRSAWGVLAPFGHSSEKTDIAETGRALNDELIELASRDSSNPDFEAMNAIEARLDSLEAEMRAIAFKISVTQLRATLPDCASHNRRGVLDLLDVMLGAELLGLDGTRKRIPSIDYVITLLCSGGEGQPLCDPVQLTPSLHELCERCSVDYDPRLPEIEAEFFHAADMYEADSRGEQQLHALQTRKAELGSGYFAPQVLRAIVTYNAALLQRIDEKVLASQDWGSLPPVVKEPQRAIPVFDSAALPQIAQALRRRAAGNAPELSAVDRIAWCLDLENLSSSERRSLLAESESPTDNLTGTVILIGLLCRASIILEDEYPAAGFTSTQLFDEWVPEVSEALQQKVNRGLSGDDYREACKLSELKGRFRYASMAEVRRKNRTRAPTPEPGAVRAPETPGSAETAQAAKTTELARPAGAEVRMGARRTAEAAKPIVREALADVQTAALKKKRAAWKDWSTRRLAAIGVATASALLVILMGPTLLWDVDHVRLNRYELNQVSSYLSHGSRNEKGRGPAFVGEIRDNWSRIADVDQMLAATELVEALRESGVRDVMIYDDDGFLRIQALGEQSPQLLPGSAPEP